MNNTIFTYPHSSDLYTEPSLLKGIARTFDLFGTLDRYNTRDSEVKADQDALKRDWQIIGLDILRSLKIYGKIKHK